MSDIDFDLDSFVTVDKANRWGYMAMVDIVRVTGSGLSMAGNVFERYLATGETERASISIQYSEKHKALRLSKEADPASGYTYTREPKGISAKGPMPSGLKMMGIARGTYRADQGNPDIFVLDETTAYEGARYGSATNNDGAPVSAEERYAVEDGSDVEVDDIVSWAFRGGKRAGVEGGRTLMIGTGRVLEITPGIEDGEPASNYALVEIISKAYRSFYPRRLSVRLRLDTLIIREKHNADQ